MKSPFINQIEQAVPMYIVDERRWKHLCETNSDVRQWGKTHEFEGKDKQSLVITGATGHVETVYLGMSKEALRWSIAGAAKALPEGVYQLADQWSEEELIELAIGWGLGAYQFTRYKKRKHQKAQLCIPPDVQYASEIIISSICLARDLINTPAADMMPEQLSEQMQEMAKKHQANFTELVGDELSDQFEALRVVGQASDHAPRLLSLEWGNPDHPKLMLVGKGVCFDTGGLDIKASPYMRQMKKDMGGAAQVLALANWIMGTNFPVRLEIMIGAADNAISGNAFRPGDVINTSADISVEVDNTDAEGRLVICEALHRAKQQQPDLLMDFATLTGAARVALGTEVPVFFTNGDETQTDLMASAQEAEEMIWPLPIVDSYEYMLKSDVADLQNSANSGYAGAITAALFLRKFVGKQQDWVHVDVMAFNNRSRPGRPKGGEAMGLFAVMQYLTSRYVS